VAYETEAVCDYYLGEFRVLEEEFTRVEASGRAVPDPLRQRLGGLCEEMALRFMQLASSSCDHDVAATLRAHPLHREVILQSSVLRQALVKPRGYAGDMDLMLKICRSPVNRPDGFSQHLDSFYCDLPASQAVRDRVCMLGRIIDELRPGSRVLNLACGPALEVEDHFHRWPDSNLAVDLVDHDIDTLGYLRGRVPADRVRLLQGNALRMLAGDLQVRPIEASTPGAERAEADRITLLPGYDLIYSAGLYDYIPDGRSGRGGVTALTAVLAGLLAPGGRLLVGNYLRPGLGSRHQLHHRAIMELYSDWRLLYRDASEIRDFASAVERPHTVELIDESGRGLRSAAESVIGFAAIHAY
jgi:SAM-dependent methyltransferase